MVVQTSNGREAIAGRFEGSPISARQRAPEKICQPHATMPLFVAL
jgi:hypothetical protein